jgi:hypothetical protein
VSGLLLKASYTWSKTIDTSDNSIGSFSWNYPSFFYRNRAVAGYDRTQVLQFAWVYDLPLGPGKKWVTQKGVVRAIAREWQANGVFSAYTGTPFTVSAAATSLNSPSNAQTADQVKSIVQKLGGIGIGTPFFDPTAFAPVTAVAFGNSGRNILRGPGVVNVDLSIFRGFTLTERVKLQFRAEAFNATNTPHFSNPNANVSVASNFGAITAAQTDQRRLRLGLRLSF